MSKSKDVSFSQLKAKVSKISNFEEFVPDWIDLENIIPRNQPWLWPNIIPLETCTLLAGAGGIGKSTFLTSLISYVTNGESFDCCGDKITVQAGSVILLAAEDQSDTCLKPNLLASNANLKLLHPIIGNKGKISGKFKFLDLNTELNVLENKIKELKTTDFPCKLLVIDPISYFTGNLKHHLEVEVANFIQNLNELAKKYELAIIINKHLRKKSGKQTIASIVDEVGGSAAWVNTPRQSFAFMRHPIEEDKILIFNLKVNITKKMNKAFCFTIHETEINYQNQIIKGKKLVWAEKMESISMEDAANKESFNKSKEEQAIDFIYNYLKEMGVTRINVLNEGGKKAGFADRTFRNAYSKMEKEGTITRKTGDKLPHFKLVE